ncbi:MAG: hypothetical protein ACREUP_11760, partial [Burkholderiales bacterium]
THDTFIDQPIFPFNLMFLPEIYGLEYRIPRKNIRSVVERKSFVGRRIINLEFSTPDGKQHSIDLRLRGMDQFLTGSGNKMKVPSNPALHTDAQIASLSRAQVSATR